MNKSLPPFLSSVEAEVRKFQAAVEKANKILVTTHQKPDGDAVGSTLALSIGLSKLGKQVTSHTPDPVPSYLSFLPGQERTTQKVSVADYDLVVALDHSELKRTGLAQEIISSKRTLVSIDHHVTSDRVGDILIIIPDAAATAEILTEVIKALDVRFDEQLATNLLTGIVTDTGSFQHANTTAHALLSASYLMEYGANMRAIIHSIFGGRSLPALRIIGRALERVQTNQKTGAAISVITNQDLQECGASLDDLSGVVNILNTIPEANFSFLLTEYEKGKLKGSLRSEPEKKVDVSQIAAQFGGGGHKLASGFEVAGTLIRDESGWRIV